MGEAKAKLQTYRQSPRKVRLVTDLVKGKRVQEAMDILTFTAKRAAKPLQKLISSALANAKDLSLDTDNLVIKDIRVDEGKTLHRRRPRSRGMSNPIRKRTSHVSLTLAPGKVKKKEEAKA